MIRIAIRGLAFWAATAALGAGLGAGVGVGLAAAAPARVPEMAKSEIDAVTRIVEDVFADWTSGVAKPEPAIWIIEKPNGGQIALFGSVHLLPEGDSWRTAALAAAYRQADVIVLETDLAEMSEAAPMAYLAAKSLNPPGVTLSSLLSDAEKEIVSKGATKAGISLAWMEGFRPWFVALQMSVAYAVAQGFSPDEGVDHHIEQEGKADGKAFDYFERPREQLDLFIELPDADQIAFLVMGARELLERPDEMKTLVAAWSRGDTEALDKLMNRGLADTPAIAKALLNDRNERWVKKIRNFYLKDRNSYLIVVGAGHLVGENSVPAKLREAGVDVEGPE